MKFSSDSASIFLNFNTASTIGVCELIVSSLNVNCIEMTGCESSSGTILITDSSIALSYKNSGTSKLIYQRLTYSPVRSLMSKITNEDNIKLHMLTKTNDKHFIEEISIRRSLYTFSNDWIVEISNVSGGSIQRGCSVFDSDLNTIFSSACFDNRFLFISLNSSSGTSSRSRYTNSFGTSACNIIESSIQQGSKIYSIPQLDSIQYLYVYDINSDSFTNHFAVSTSEFYFSMIAKSYMMYIFGSNSYSSWTKCNMSKICLSSFDHTDLAVTTNVTRALVSTEYPLSVSTPAASSLVFGTAVLSTSSPVETSTFSVNPSPSPDTFSSDFVFYLDDYVNLNVAEKSTLTLAIDLPCSISGSSSITYILVSIGTESVPNWVQLSSFSPNLLLSTPDVSRNTNFTFGVQSTVNNYKYVKSIKLQIIDNPIPTSSTGIG